MTIVSTKEFISNQQKYFDLAEENENVCIKRGNSMFYLIYQPEEKQYPEQVVLQPDDNLRSAITAEELLNRVHEDIHNKFALRV